MNDDNRNMILAMGLSLLVIVGWYAFFAPEPPPPADPATQTQEAGLTTPEATAEAAAGGAEIAANNDPSASAGRVTIESPLVQGSLSLAGGRIDDLALRDYRETIDPNSPLVRLLNPTTPADTPAQDTALTPGESGADAGEHKPYYAVYGWMPAAGTDPAALPGPTTLWQVESGASLAPGQPVTLKWDNGQGQIFRRTYALDDKYLFTVTQSLENSAAQPFSAAPYGIIARHGLPKMQNFFILHEGAVGMIDGELSEQDYDDITDFDAIPREGRAEITKVTENGWIGFTDKYWMTALAPAPGQAFDAVIKYGEGADIYQTESRLPVQTVAAGAQAEATTYLFAGAKVYDVLKGYETTPGIARLVDAIDWGWFYFLTKPIFHLLHFLNGLIGNMGWAIIALTFVLKLLVFPLARKSYVSMARMRELQPEMEALKERTGEDRQRYQKEVMELYKREKVNPAAGCLPVLLQVPIFFSLYKVIFVTIELRHAPWWGWIRDLSAPDPSSILNLFGLLSFAAPARDSMFGIFSLSILAILLGISMWVQQKLNPAPTDPTQKFIFAWMPWIFMFMLGGFASGLVLYWITNNTITILQQYTIMKMHGHPPDLFGNIRDSFRRKS